MKKRKGFKLRNVCGEHVIVAEGQENIDFSKIISLNDTAAYLWEGVKDKAFTTDDLVDLLINEYEVDKATARKDCDEMLTQWLNAEIIED